MTNAGDYAVQAIQQAAEAGIIHGMGSGELMPKSALTRAEALQVAAEN